MFEVESAERKRLQALGEVPLWYTTQGFIMFKKKYAYNGETVKGAFTRIATTLAKHSPFPDAKDKFFDLLWSGKLAPSTPVMSNTGTPRGMSVSCAGNYIGDSVAEFYEGYTEIAVLSKLGFGTASYLGDIRPRGSIIKSTGTHADGILAVVDSCLDTVTKINQGGRRGAHASYIPFSHQDFDEICGYIIQNPGAVNIGWTFEEKDITDLKNKDPEAIRRWNEILYIRCRTGKGYLWRNDNANALAPQAVKNSGIRIKNSQLCTEIALPADEEHTFTCILSSLNLTMWDSITVEDIKWSIYFLDAVCTDFLEQAKTIKHMEKAVRFTEKARALGLGTLGFHSLLQSKNLAFESFDAMLLNEKIYSTIMSAATEASQELARISGEPEWCAGTGLRNATLITIAPNMSSAILAGGVSQGVEPYINNAYIQQSAAGDYVRYNPYFMELLKQKGKYSLELLKDIAQNYLGSVQHLDFLSDHEKNVFKTAYELDQNTILMLASSRQKFIDQAQSINLFFSADADEKYIAQVHKNFLLDPYLKSLYYLRSERGVKSTKDCVACEG